MKLSQLTSVALATAAIASPLFAQQGPVPQGVPHLDHVFVIMMENHGYSQILNNPNAPFTNKYAAAVNTGTNYFAVAHPSLTNYLEVVGGSNFGVLNDHDPDWHNANCMPNLATGQTSFDNSNFGATCPIAGMGTDAATPKIDYSNETTGLPGDIEIDGVRSIPASSHILGMSIADQLVAAGLSYKSYQENLPLSGADRVNTSDGFFSNLTDFTKLVPAQTPALTYSSVVALYADKHNPFIYFRSTQEGYDSRNTLANSMPWDGPNGLYADLATGHVPTYSFIAPNQCDDQHGRGNAGPFCNYDPTSDGTQAGLNPALISRGDTTLQRVVSSIHHSPVWHEGRSAIVVLWDENDYSTAPNTNQVLLIVDTNYGVHGVRSSNYYNHFSLLRTIEGGLRLPCLNHACDNDSHVMTDLFAGKDGDDRN
ncbi:MAG: phosphoesterase [Acidobacteriota bacterium]|nr:phosphoesterase [Acidobacteriota bacterium]